MAGALEDLRECFIVGQRGRKGRATFAEARRAWRRPASEQRPLDLPTRGFKRLRQSIDAAQPEDLEVEQRGLFDGYSTARQSTQKARETRTAHGAGV